MINQLPDSIDTIDITGENDNTLNLTTTSILEPYNNNISQLLIDGDAVDTVNIGLLEDNTTINLNEKEYTTNDNGQISIDSEMYTAYTTNDLDELLVRTDISVVSG